MLAVLAAEPRSVPRDRLLVLFWPESDTERARHSLDQTLYALKRDAGGLPLVVGREQLTLDPDAIGSDIADFRAAIAQQRWADAVALSAGPFLDGVYVNGAPEFERWADAQRAHVTQDVERALEALATEAAQRGDPAGAAEWWRRLAALDPRKTRVVMSLMQALAASGDRAGALRQADVYRTLLEDDQGVAPNPAVAALADRLRRDPVASPTYSPVPASPPRLADFEDGASGTVADRFALERVVGRGGSATVHRARDLRNDRTVALKILHPELAAGLGVERFQHEITVTANLQHPHILPIHDSGEWDGSLFLVMPFVEGESLRERLTREQRLPVADVVRLAREIGSALAYAHTRGIVHRDVKPENILLSSGHAVVADFGLALALHAATEGPRRTAPGIVLGTLNYLSPEQASGSADARSDQYCLAAVLYEALAGARPHQHADPAELIAMRESESPRSLLGIRGDVPEALDRAILRALSPDPDARFPSVAAFVEALQHVIVAEASPLPERVAVPDRPPSAIRGRRGALLALALPVALVAGWWAWTRVRAPSMSERAWVVLAGLENRTGDSLLDHALDAVVEAGLEQSAYVNLVPRARIRSTLAMMRRDSSTAPARVLDESLAREIAQRNGVSAVIAGSIDRVDSTYVVALRLLRASDGDQLGALTSVAPTRGAIVDAVDDVVRRMRRRIGESTDSLAKRDRPLPQATTRSLEALRLYGDGLAASRAGDRNAATELWRRAVAIDSEFVSAHVELGAAAYINNRPPEGEAHFAAALRFLDRATDREQLRARAAIESHRGNRDSSVVLRRMLVASYPDDVGAWRQLGYDLMRSNRSREAEAAYRQVLARDSSSANDYVNFASVLSQMGRHADAVRAYRRAFTLEPSLLMVNNVNTEYGTTLVLAGRPSEARAAHDTLLSGGVDQQAHGLRSIGLLLMTEGRYREAIGFLRRAVAASDRPNRSLTLARNRLFLAAALRERGARDSARAEVLAAYAIFQRSYLDPAFLVTLGRALVRSEEPRLARVVLDSLRARMPASPNPVLASDQLLLRGELALDAGRADSALRLMDVPRAMDRTVFSLDGPARALEALGQHAAAARRYEAIAADPDLWLGREGVEVGVLARLHAARAFEAAGDPANARRNYERFLEAWPAADPDLPPVRLARERSRALRRPGA